MIRKTVNRAWPDVAAAVSTATGATWSVKRLQQSVRRLVAEGLVDRTILGRSALPRRRRSDELAVLVKGIALANPQLSLRAIGGQLEAMKNADTCGLKRVVIEVCLPFIDEKIAGITRLLEPCLP